MAIQLDLSNSTYGIPFAGAYFRIMTSSISRNYSAESKFSVVIDVAGYATNQPSLDDRHIDFRRYFCSLEEIESSTGNSFLEKCYNWVMGRQDMAGSIGV